MNRPAAPHPDIPPGWHKYRLHLRKHEDCQQCRDWVADRNRELKAARKAAAT